MQRRRPPAGAAPGTLAPGRPHKRAKIFAYVYDHEGCREQVVNLEALGQLQHDGKRLWVDVQGLDDGETVAAVGKLFDVHPLAVADAVNTPQRPKADVYGETLVLIAQMARPDPRRLVFEQLTIVVGKSVGSPGTELEFAL